MVQKTAFLLLVLLLFSTGWIGLPFIELVTGEQTSASHEINITGQLRVESSAFDMYPLEVTGTFDAANPTVTNADNVRALVDFTFHDAVVYSGSVTIGLIPAGDHVRVSDTFLIELPGSDLRSVRDEIMQDNALQLVVKGYALDTQEYFYPVSTRLSQADNLYKSDTHKIKFRYPEGLIISEDACTEWMYNDDGKSIRPAVNCIRVSEDKKNWRLYILESQKYNFLNDISHDTWLDTSKMTKKTLEDGTTVVDGVTDAQNNEIKYLNRPGVSFKVRFFRGFNETDAPYQYLYDSIELF
jgi:hypothetical protein